MRDLGLPEQYDHTLKCMLNSTTTNAQEEVGEEEFPVKLKPNFPFDLSLTTLIESYMCRIHKTLKDRDGEGLPLQLYNHVIRDIFRDKRRVLPHVLCGKAKHSKYDKC